MLKAYAAWRAFQDRVLAPAGAVLFVGSTLLALLEVGRRYVLGRSFEWQQDAVTFFILSGVFLYFSISQRRDAHLTVTLIPELFNAFVDRQFAFLLATARCAPRDLPLRRDLATRLASGLTYRVLPLTDHEKRAALAAHARARGFELSEEVASYLLNHARRDMGSLMSALDAIDQYSLETRRPVTVPLLKAAIQP